MAKSIHSMAPVRVDLAGGTLDIWPLYLFHEDSLTVNAAIDLYARCTLTARNDSKIELVSHDLKARETYASLSHLRLALRSGKRLRLPLLARLVAEFGDASEGPRAMPQSGNNEAGFTLETDSGSPPGAGLGGSSALNIAICGALNKFTGRRLPPRKLIEIARNVEAQVLRVPAGEQDYYSAMYSGLQAIHLTPHGIEPEKLAADAADFNTRFVLCYSGRSRNSGINNWEVEKAHIDGDRAVIRHFERIARGAAEMREALLRWDWASVAKLINQDWEQRKKNHPGITTPEIEQCIKVARRAGAVAAKACGAGGGGCVLFLVEPGGKPPVEAALRAAGAVLLPCGIAPHGLAVR